VFFDVLSSELNLEGVVYFFSNSLPQIVQAIEKHFWPVENALREASATQKLEISIGNVLRKKYQSNWRQIG
jgi:DNA/RNA endonuclease G (NUC1)|tara:strand:- start:642 stop:854 length:213 start_codon:yes stop_codon:yes gene_type:complete